jgi:hypothetical protein
MEVRNLLQWRNRSGFSPDSLTFDCEFDELTFTVFKERSSFKAQAKIIQEVFQSIFITEGANRDLSILVCPTPVTHQPSEIKTTGPNQHTTNRNDRCLRPRLFQALNQVLCDRAHFPIHQFHLPLIGFVKPAHRRIAQKL